VDVFLPVLVLTHLPAFSQNLEMRLFALDIRFADDHSPLVLAELQEGLPESMVLRHLYDQTLIVSFMALNQAIQLFLQLLVPLPLFLNPFHEELNDVFDFILSSLRWRIAFITLGTQRTVFIC
jgi:hypothetical protein